MATAIANADARAEVERLAEEQAALRRVATLVAEDVPASELCGAVVEEVGRLLGSDSSGMIRYEADGMVTAAATWIAEGEHPPVEGRWSLEGDTLATTIFRERRPTREDDWYEARGPIAESAACRQPGGRGHARRGGHPSRRRAHGRRDSLRRPTFPGPRPSP
jgi:hypothetical protein